MEPDTRARAREVYGLFLDVIDAALALPDPVEAGQLLVDIVRASAELRLHAEVATGRLLLVYPDPGGRPSPSKPAPAARLLRESVGMQRAAQARLTALGKLTPEQVDAVADELWAGYPRGGVQPTPSLRGDGQG